VRNSIRWIILGLLLMVMAQPAFAQNHIIVDDPTNTINIGEVQRAARTLASKGATVVVLVSDQTGSNAQAYASGILKTYGIATDPLSPNVIIYLVSLDQRNVYIYYGSDWNSALGPTYQGIINDSIIPPISRNNDITKGIVEGFNATVDAIDNPPGSVSNDFLAWLIGLPVIGGIVVFLMNIFNKRRRAAQALANARGIYEQARRSAGAAIADMGQLLVSVREKAQYDSISYPPAEIAQLAQWQQEAEKLFIVAQGHFDNADEALAAKASPTEEDYKASAVVYEQIVTEVAAAREPLERADARRRELDQLNAQAPGSIDQSKKALADVAEQLDMLREDGARPDAITRTAAELIARAEALLAEHHAADAIATAEEASATLNLLKGSIARYNDIREGISAGRAAAEKVVAQNYRIEDGLAAFDESENLLRQALKALEMGAEAAAPLLDQAEASRAEGVARGGGMPALRSANDGRLIQVDEAGKQLSAYIDEGRRAFDIVDEFAESTWSDIRGNGSEAEAAAAEALRLWQRASQRNTMEVQDFLGAQQDLDAAEQYIAQARQLIDAIIQRLKDLEAARDAARSEIAMAQADIEQGWAYIRANDPDIGKVPEQQLHRAEELLAQANAELAKQRPDWLLLVKLAQEANQQADQALADARSEVDTMNKLRSEVEHAQQVATAEVQKIVKFAGIHTDDVDDQLNQRINQLQNDVQKAYKALKLAEQSEEEARVAALNKAQKLYATLATTAEQLYADMYAAFQRGEELRKKVQQQVKRAQREIERAEDLVAKYRHIIPRTSEGHKRLSQARNKLGRIGKVRDERSAQDAIELANQAYADANRADKIFRAEINARHGGRGGGGGVIIIGGGGSSGSSSSSGGSSGWGSGGGSWGGWGGGGGGGWGGGGGGGGWGGSGGGGSGW